MAQRKLLVADDSLTIQKVIRLALGSEGYEIQTVSDGAQALEQITTFRPDIVLIDVSLAKKSAFEVKKEVNEHPDLSHIKFVLMSSAFKQVDETQAGEAGFDARLIKPFDPAHLRNIISSTLGTESASSPAPQANTSTKNSKRNEVGFGEFLSHLNNPPPDEFGADPKPLSQDSGEEETQEAPASVTPPEGMSDDLWKTDAGISSPSHSGEDDIRKLTESTLKMSGFADDSGWSVQEKKAPSSFQSNDLGFQFTMPDMQSSKPDPILEPHKQHYDFQSSWSESASNDFSPNTSFTETKAEEPKYEPKREAPSGASASSTQMTLDPNVLEGIIQREVSAALEKVLKNMLPDIAERVIKDEIHKMLSNPPKGL